MADTVERPSTPEVGTPEGNLAPRTRRAFEELRRAILTEGALDSKNKQLIAVAVAHLTQCQHCIEGHTRLANRAGATHQEITESIWVATEVRAGGTFAHPTRTAHLHPCSTPTDRNRDDWSH